MISINAYESQDTGLTNVIYQRVEEYDGIDVFFEYGILFDLRVDEVNKLQDRLGGHLAGFHLDEFLSELDNDSEASGMVLTVNLHNNMIIGQWCLLFDGNTVKEVPLIIDHIIFDDSSRWYWGVYVPDMICGIRSLVGYFNRGGVFHMNLRGLGREIKRMAKQIGGNSSDGE